MIFATYHREAARLKELKEIYSSILAEKEELFQMTQPGAIRYDKEPVDGGKLASNNFDEYLQKLKDSGIDGRLAEVEDLIEKRKDVVADALFQLLESKELLDQIYVMAYVKRMKVHRIASRTGYAESHIYRLLVEIRENLKDDKK